MSLGTLLFLIKVPEKVLISQTLEDYITCLNKPSHSRAEQARHTQRCFFVVISKAHWIIAP